MTAVRRAFLPAVTAALLVLCTVPYALAASRTPPGARFTGVVYNHFDQDYYLAAQRSVADGLPRRNRFTAEPEAPGPVAPLYRVSGWLQRVTGLPTMVAYHLPRLLAVAAFPWVLAALYRLCFPDRPDRARWAVVLALSAAGPLAVASWFPGAARSGERIPESVAVLSLTVFPHFAVSYLGLTLAFVALAMAVRGRPPVAVGGTAAAAGVLLALGHAFLVLPVALMLAALAAAALVRRGGPATGCDRRSVIAAAAVLAPLAPVVVVLRGEQDRLERLNGAYFPTARADAWWTWFLGWGVVSLLAAVGLARMARRREDRQAGPLLLAGWLAVQFLLVYLPWTVFQRRYAEGLVVPLAGLGAIGLAASDRRSPVGRGLAAVAVAVPLLAVLALANYAGSTPQYLDRPTRAALARVGEDDVVLAGRDLSWLLPAFSPGTSYVARPVETIRYRPKLAAARRWAADPAAPASRRWLAGTGVTLVVVDGGDRTFRPAGLPGQAAAACLQPVFHHPPLAAWRVVPGCLAAPED